MARILFQAMNSRLFRSVFIGYLYEIAQKHRVLLLAEEFDEETKSLLQDKNLFPGLEGVIFFESAFDGDVVGKNYRLCKTLRNEVRDFKPDLAIAHSDLWPADMYALRFAKQAGAITVAMQAGFKIAGERKLYLWSCLMNTYLKMPEFLPFSVRFFLSKVKKYLGHVLYYWILPITAGERPFLGRTSFVFWDEASGLRDAAYVTVFTERDRDLHIRDGVKPEKVFVIGHPADHQGTREFFEKTYFAKRGEREELKMLTIMWPDEKIGLRADDHSLISEEEMKRNRAFVVSLLAEKFPDWKIVIKPHPAVQTIAEAQKLVGPVPDNVSIVNPLDPADIYIAQSSVIVGIPPPSTTLFSAIKENLDAIVLSLNLHGELLGDAYKNFEGIEYIDTKEKLIAVLNSIQQGSYRKDSQKLDRLDFSNTNEFLKHIGIN